MNKEENDNHIVIEVLNENGDLKLTKFRSPRAIWQNNDYPDEYTFRDVDIVNVFQLQQENKKYKEVIEKAINYINDNLIISSILDGKKYYTINDYSFDYKELLDILKEVNKYE